MGDFTISSVVTTNKGAVVHLENTDEPYCPMQGSECKDLKDKYSPRHIAFYDKNSNNRLDEGDERIEIYCDLYDNLKKDYHRTSSLSRSLPSGYGGYTFKGDVTEEDIKTFGGEVTDIFIKASQDRTALEKLKGLKITSGQCVIPFKYFDTNVEKSNRDHNHFQRLETRFNPPLSLETKGVSIDEKRSAEPSTYEAIVESLRYYTQYTVKIDHLLYKGNIDPKAEKVDPAQCLSAVARVNLSKYLKSQTTTGGWGDEAKDEKGELYFGFATEVGQSKGSEYYGDTVPWANEFNIENDRQKVDALYEWYDQSRIDKNKHQVNVVHLDLTPSNKKAAKTKK